MNQDCAEMESDPKTIWMDEMNGMRCDESRDWRSGSAESILMQLPAVQ